MRLHRTNGFTLLEVSIALAVLVIAVLSIAGLFNTAAISAHSQMDLGQDVVVCESKMEELRTLDFNDTTTDTTVVPYGSSGTGLSPGGSVDPASPAAGYVDYLDPNAAHTTASGAVYTRLWQITDNGSASTNGTTSPSDSKTITVRCIDDSVSKSNGLKADVTLATERSQ
jgi:prepilin-type N-terminal cleavage/methylation domain-containing protein